MNKKQTLFTRANSLKGERKKSSIMENVISYQNHNVKLDAANDKLKNVLWHAFNLILGPIP